MRIRKKKRRKENIEKLRRELEKEGIRVENNPDALVVNSNALFIVSEIRSEIKSLSYMVMTFGVAIIGIIVAFGLH